MPRLVNGVRKIEIEKHLVFDCDSPKTIQDLILKMKESKHNYILDYSNLLFEIWLVMHFQDIKPTENYKKRKIYNLMKDFLKVAEYNSKVKADKGTIGIILGSDGNKKIRDAIENAKEIENY